MLLLVGAYESLAGSNPRIGLIGLASGGGSNKHSTASSRHLSLPCLYILSLLSLIGGDGLRNTPPIGSDSLFFTFSA